MNKIILFCILALSVTSICPAQTNQTESLTITTYFPSPYGVYRYLKLSPTDSAPGSPSPGMIYYNNISDSLLYHDNAGWVNLSGGSGGGGGGNGTYWKETAAHNIYNNNTGFVGIGTQTPNAPLTVYMSNSDPANATVTSLIRHVNGTPPDQYLHFNLYTSNAGAYMNSSSVINAPQDPQENIEFVAVNQTRSIRINVGNFSDPYSEVMRLVNPNGSQFTGDEPDPRVGIGTKDPLFPLQVDSDREDVGVLAIRGLRSGRKTGIFNVVPWDHWVDLTYGAYLQGGNWMNDPYEYAAGQFNHYYAKFIISSDSGVYWFAGDRISGNNIIPYTGPPLNPLGGWNLAFEEKLWDHNGKWVNAVIPPSSRKLKENFVKIKPEDILEKIDRLEISRWNYRSDDRSVTHIGPFAEDFYRLFRTGPRENQLQHIDLVGISLAGVKALSRKINTQEKVIEELESEIKSLRAQLSK